MSLRRASGLAMSKSNLIPDIMNGQLYKDNRRSPGYLRVEPSMANNVFYVVTVQGTASFSKRMAIRRLRLIFWKKHSTRQRSL